MDSEKLVNLFWDRSPEAIAQTQQAYGELCAKLADRLLRRAEDVEECVNDTYLALWNGIPPARPANFGAYVAKIVRNLAMKRLSYLTAEKRSAEADPFFRRLFRRLKYCAYGFRRLHCSPAFSPSEPSDTEIHLWIWSHESCRL